MKNWSVGILLPALLLGLLAGCGNDVAPASPATVPQTEPTTAVEDPIGTTDTYWVTYEHFDEEYNEFRSTEAKGWFMDLVIRADGTARFRDIYNQLCIMDEDSLHLQWERNEGTLQFYNQDYDYPLLEGAWNNGVLELKYRGTPLKLAQKPMPQTVGELYSPAELLGTWVAVSAENEGDQWDLMPISFESMVFWVDASAEDLTLVADMDIRDHFGGLESSRQGLRLEQLQEPLYTDCVNDQWSVRVGPASQLDENGVPTDQEQYVTLVDQNELLLQTYFSIEGAPAVSYVTYRRMPPAVTWWNVEQKELCNTNWYCAGYLDTQGNMCQPPAQFKDLLLQFGDEGTCYVDGTPGQLFISGGSAIMLCAENEFWYGGAIRASYSNGSDPFYELYLYHEGGLLRFLIESYG